MKNAFLFETKEIEKSIFKKFEIVNIFYCYFLAQQKYYLFLFKKEPIDFNLIYESVQVVDQLNSRKREIRSIRGFILYALEIMETDKNYQILETNLEPFFWKNVKRVINQNKKNGLQDFLFPVDQVDIESLKKKIQYLENSQSNDSIFQNLKNISDTEKEEIIKKGFQLQSEGRISLKDYYEGNKKNSLLKFKGYRIKYQSVRRSKLYKELKEVLI